MKYKRLYLKLSDQELGDAIVRFHFEGHEEFIRTLLSKAELWAKPECYYIFEQSCQDYVTVIVTLGSMIDKKSQEFQQQEHFLEAHALDCLSLALLSQSYEKIKEIIRREKRQFVSELYFPEDIMIPEIIKKIKENYGDFQIQVNEAGALIPSKTVVFYGKLSQHHESSGHTCSTCKNITCPLRACGI